MALEITIPRLGWNMEEGVFLAWFKKHGDVVQAGEPLYSLEGDKSVQDVPAIDSGILHLTAASPREGDRVVVGACLGYLLADGEAPPALNSVAAPAAPVPKATPAPVPKATPAISPRARRVAAELGVDWTQLKGSGNTGRIHEHDVRAAAQAPTAENSTPLSPTRQTIVRRLLDSLRATASVTLTATADATNLVALREQFKSVRARGFGTIPGFTDLVVKLTALALESHPLLNSRWEADRVVTCDGIHIGIAVDTDAGLVVPVVRDVPRLGLRQLAVRSRELIEKARERRLTAGDMHGGTFTVSNLGPFGVEAFTPIINHPECAILGLGRIRRMPAVVDDRVVARDQVTLSLTFDHRIVDGAPAARFLDSLRRLLENPSPWLME
jgi:pyruvate dehydrogenase E2 component (dihydrolipoamide acetyltransferase)